MSRAAAIPDAWKEWLLRNRDRGCDLEGLMQRYGAGVQAEGGAAVDRAALGRIVFQDPAERRWLEQLVHPVSYTHLTLPTIHLV